MKKLSMLLIVGATALCLTACGERSGEAYAKESVQETNEVATFLNAVTSDGQRAEQERPPIREICEGYLAGDVSEYVVDEENGWIRVDFPDSIESYFPGAVYHHDDWTPEGVLESYRDKTARWIHGQEAVSNWEFLWSRDYETKFTVRDDGWLYIDRVRIAPVNPETHSVELKDMLEAYQTGEWDGHSEWRSEDLSTTVSMSDITGELLYAYAFANYPASVPYSEFAYSNYSTRPCYEGINDVEVDIINMSTSGAPGTSIVPPLPDEDRYDWLSKADYELVYTERARVGYYLDYPGGILGEAILYTNYDAVNGNLYTVTAEGVQLYHQGTPLNMWSCDVDEDDSFLALYGDVDYLITGDKIITLNRDGSTDVACDRIIDLAYDFEGLFYALRISEEGELAFWHPDCDDYDYHLIASNVTDAWGDDIICFTEADGYAYVLAYYDEEHHTWIEVNARDLMYHHDYELFKLGQETPDYYCQMFHTIRSSNWFTAMRDFLTVFADLDEMERLTSE